MKALPKESVPPKLEDLIDMEDPRAVFAEVCHVAGLIHPELDLGPLRRAFKHTLQLFAGQYPGYRACNTRYHDLKHTMDCFMAMVRLLHGASIQGFTVSPANLVLGLLAALHHDTGYIQENNEISGTGGRFTLIHIDRSISFMEKYAGRHANSGICFPAARHYLKCTGLDVRIDGIAFESPEHEMIGKALGSADLLGQMADRTYIERLSFLFCEYKEGNVPGFKDELHLVRSTPAFWEYTKVRLAVALGGVDQYMPDHFRVRWGVDLDLYKTAVEANMQHLKYLLEDREGDYRDLLRRRVKTEIYTGAEAAEMSVSSKLP